MKKIIISFLIITLMSTCITACSSSGDEVSDTPDNVDSETIEAGVTEEESSIEEEDQALGEENSEEESDHELSEDEANSAFEVTGEFSFNEDTEQPIYVIIAKNTTDIPLDFESNVTAYDSDGNAIGTGYDYEFSVAAGDEACLYNYFDETENVDHYDYRIDLYKGYESVADYLDITVNDTGEKIVVSGTSTADHDISGASVSAVFLLNGEYVSAADEGIISNGDYVIKPGETYSTELETYYSYDEVKVFVSGDTRIY